LNRGNRIEYLVFYSIQQFCKLPDVPENKRHCFSFVCLNLPVTNYNTVVNQLKNCDLFDEKKKTAGAAVF
jgi:hypothetical protein